VTSDENWGETVHGTAVALEGRGILIRGPSGSGKSLLALALLDEWESRGREAMLVADDGVGLRVEGDQVIMEAPETIAGLIELRGRGVVERPHVGRARLNVVIDLVAALERMPEESAFVTRVGGLEVARCPVPQAGLAPVWHQMLLIKEALRPVAGEKLKARQKDT
jgi:serine kinase of HPr protein (carbohydrate metabolism regulator)